MAKLKANRVFQETYVRPNPGRTLVVGSKIYEGQTDRRSMFSDAVGVDMLPGDGVDFVLDMEGPECESLGLFDHIDCHSVLEHSRKPWALAENLQRLLRDGGSIFVSVPFVWRVHAYPNDYFRFTPEGVKLLFPIVSWAHVALVGETIEPPKNIRGIDTQGWTYFPKTEVLAFGHKTPW